MPFKRKCATEELHEEWGIRSPYGSVNSRIPAAVKDWLLRKCGKSVERHFSKRLPAFCEQCIGQAELILGLQSKRKSTPVDSEIPSPDVCVPSSSQSETPSTDLEKRTTAERARLTFDPDVCVPSSPQSETPSIDLEKMTTAERARLAFHPDVCVPSSSQFETPSIDLEKMTTAERARLAFDLARFERDAVLKSSREMSNNRTLSQILSLDCSDTNSLNRVILAFAEGMQSDTKKDEKPYQLYKTVEAVMNLSGTQFCLPAHFRESVVLYTLSGSKLVAQVLGASGAHASYQSIKSWLNDLAGSEPACEASDKDVLVTFDNNQVLARRWKVKLRHDAACSTVTMVIHFEVNSQYQMRSDEHPRNWMRRALTVDEVKTLSAIDRDQSIRATHYEHLKTFLTDIIEKVRSEQIEKKGSITDSIDDLVSEEEYQKSYHTCAQCNLKDIPKEKRKCPSCKAKLTSRKEDPAAQISEKMSPHCFTKRVEVTDKARAGGGNKSVLVCLEEVSENVSQYSKFENECSASITEPKLKVLPPIAVNPCSYEAVLTTLRNIGETSGVVQYGGKREWVLITCDGVPYNLARRVIRSFHQCSVCHESINGLDQCEKHRRQVHQNSEVEFQPEFDWIVLLPGLGHIEMNMVKGLFELGWDVFWKEMAILFNFRSEKALQCCKKVTDHHKGWTMCRVAREAIAMELILPFVRREIKKQNSDYSVSSFLDFCASTTNPMFAFMTDFLCELLDSVFMFRVGVRGGITKYTEAALAKFGKVWCGRHHPLYRELEMSFHIQHLRMPETLKDFVRSSFSINMTGVPFTAEAPDFRLEEVNRQVQHWLPHVPSPNDWQLVCKNYSKLCDMRERLFQQIGIKDPKSSSKSLQNIESEVRRFRALIRSKNLLSYDDLGEPKGLGGTPLDQEYYKFCSVARNIRAEYAKDFLHHESVDERKSCGPPAFKAHPIPITTDERAQQNTNNKKNKHVLIGEVWAKVELISDEQLRMEIQNDLKTLQKNKASKSDIIALLVEIESFLSSEYVDAEDSLDQ